MNESKRLGTTTGALRQIIFLLRFGKVTILANRKGLFLEECAKSGVKVEEVLDDPETLLYARFYKEEVCTFKLA